MKKLVVSLVTLGLVGVAPAHAHLQEGVKCSGKILDKTFVPPEDSPYTFGHWEVKTLLSVKNVSNHRLKPNAEAGIYEADGTRLGNDELLAHRLAPGEVQRQKSIVNVIEENASIDEYRVDSCHKKWYVFD